MEQEPSMPLEPCTADGDGSLAAELLNLEQALYELRDALRLCLTNLAGLNESLGHDLTSTLIENIRHQALRGKDSA